jgi:signal peptidase I
MSPTLVDGDWLVVSWAVPKLKARKVYVIERADRPGVFVIKRLLEIGSGENVGQVWVEGDNKASTDSRQWGWISESELRARVLFRYKKAKRCRN